MMELDEKPEDGQNYYSCREYKYNVCTNFHGIPSNSCIDILLITKSVYLLITKSVGFILWWL